MIFHRFKIFEVLHLIFYSIIHVKAYNRSFNQTVSVIGNVLSIHKITPFKALRKTKMFKNIYK